MNILVIADSIELATGLCRAAEGGGHKVASYSDGNETLGDLVDAIHAAHADVVVLDLAMATPDPGGLIAALAVDRAPPAVVLCTNMATTCMNATDGCVTGVLKKPFAADALLAFLRDIEQLRLRESGVRARRSESAPPRGDRRSGS